jgi:protocatechuate 3,4-dioxygenase beta subunit
MSRDDRMLSIRVLGRRDVLVSAGAVVLGRYLVSALPRRLSPLASAAAQTVPSCIVRPQQTEGPYFVDERLNRSDIRTDPSDGSVKDGAKLALSFVVSRIDGASCVPFEGVYVDVWHCDAAGIYSDVQDPSFNTSGYEYLRGYQVTDASGAASFVTIYPGWYQGRTVHIHFKIRNDLDAGRALEFTSQLYFDDAFTDAVHARVPYAAKGQRTVRNVGDGIFGQSGDELLLAVSDDGNGGYVATFEIGIETTATGTGTAGSCTTIAACLANLQAALPDPASATSRGAKHTAQKLRRRTTLVAKALERAAVRSGVRQGKQYGKARAGLRVLLERSRAADGNGTLDVPLAALEAAIAALLDQIPSS